MGLDRDQLSRLLLIAQSNTEECYNEHLLRYGQPDQQRPGNKAETGMYQEDLLFIERIRNQEGIPL